MVLHNQALICQEICYKIDDGTSHIYKETIIWFFSLQLAKKKLYKRNPAIKLHFLHQTLKCNMSGASFHVKRKLDKLKIDMAVVMRAMFV